MKGPLETRLDTRSWPTHSRSSTSRVTDSLRTAIRARTHTDDRQSTSGRSARTMCRHRAAARSHRSYWRPPTASARIVARRSPPAREGSAWTDCGDMLEHDVRGGISRCHEAPASAREAQSVHSLSRKQRSVCGARWSCVTRAAWLPNRPAWRRWPSSADCPRRTYVSRATAVVLAAGPNSRRRKSGEKR